MSLAAPTGDAPPAPSPRADDFLDAALALVGEGGLEALTLRPLAGRIGVSVPTLTSHLGSKERIVERLITYARSQDEAFQAAWLARAALLDAGDALGRAALGEAALQSWISAARPRAVLLCALVQARRHNDSVIAALAGWFETWTGFWTALAASPAKGAALAAYFIDEAVFSLALSDREAFGVMRRLGLTQLFTGLAAGAAARKGSLALFTWVRDELAPPRSVLDRRLTPSPPKRDEIARRAADLIVSDGVETLSHRSVATAAGAPASTVVYHFGSRDELLVAALEEVIQSFRAWRANSAPPDQDAAALIALTRPLVRATAAIGFESVRHPSLAPHAADMRRRRGENITADNAPRLAPAIRAQLDPLAAQVYSVCAFGARMRAMALAADEAAAMDALHAALNSDG